MKKERIEFYLSRVRADSRVTSNPHGVHKLLWRAFPEKSPGTAQPFLFRQELSPGVVSAKCERTYLVQSLQKPDFKDVPGVVVDGVKEVQFEVQEGDHFFFRLLAAPVGNGTPEFEDGRMVGRGKKIPLRSRNLILKWLENRSEKGGFAPYDLEFSIDSGKVIRNGVSFGLTACQFDGALRVLDPELFVKAIVTGIGTKKSFGFGLMTLARS